MSGKEGGSWKPDVAI